MVKCQWSPTRSTRSWQPLATQRSTYICGIDALDTGVWIECHSEDRAWPVVLVHIPRQRCDVQSVCGTCCEEKLIRSSFRKASEKKRSKAVGDLVHTDLSGPPEVPISSGNRYCMVLIDDYSTHATQTQSFTCCGASLKRSTKSSNISLIETQVLQKSYGVKQ